MDILNKSYKRKNAPDSDTFVVDKIDGEFVVFTNGARCKIETLINDFVDVSQAVNENADLDPDKFFNTPIADTSLLNTIEQIHKNPNAQIAASSRLAESVSLDDDNIYEKVGPGANNAFADRLSNNAEQPAPKQQSQRLPEWDVFDSVKLTEEIEITIPFKIKLPRAEKIDILNDMFKTPFTAYIAKKYISDNIVNNSVKIQLMLQQAIEEWIESELGGTQSKKKKPASRKKIAVETAPTVTDIKAETVVAVDRPSDNASSFFGQTPVKSNWDGDIKKLFSISTEEQYNAVRQRFIQMKDSNSNSPDLDRYEDMLQIYESQNS